MKILVRLPNWLGDMVMSVGFLHALPQSFPGAEVSVIAKKGIHGLLPFFPPRKHDFIFDKAEHKGLAGLWSFGRAIRRTEKFDLFFCLPDSFSSALMGLAAGAGSRIGYRNEGRSVLLTQAPKKPEGLHRVEEYTALLQAATGRQLIQPQVRLHHSFLSEDYVVVNINSEASSRRLTVVKAVEILDCLRERIPHRILLIGAPKEAAFVEEVIGHLKDKRGVESRAGKTDLPGLARLLAEARLLLTTDSGPAHLGAALGTPTVVLFGAGNEANTAPYHPENRTIIRLGELSCEPCTNNVCLRYGIPQCLERLDTLGIIQAVYHQLERT